ncbi:hypothetical protein HDU96_006383 [Phlyctochytrium bullatum]|nr:hypothetical protein HDU96_006383 [Phlyctochytrium bullatum]
MTPSQSKRIRNLLLAASLACLASGASAQSTIFTNVVAFGDSYSDSGNVYRSTGNSYPASPPYWQGRFSNGPTWVENLAANLSAKLNNYAYGGAVANANALPINADPSFKRFPDLAGQIAEYEASNQNLDPASTLFVVFIGGNDYFANLASTSLPSVSTIANSVLNNIRSLYTRLNARHVLVQTLPPIQAAPQVIQLRPQIDRFGVGALVDNLASGHNNILLKGLQETALPAGAAYYWADTYSVVMGIVQSKDASSLGFSVIDQACLSGTSNTFNSPSGSNGKPAGPPVVDFGQVFQAVVPGVTIGEFSQSAPNTPLMKRQNTVCSNPDSYLFWDHLHPSAKAHEVLARIAAAAVREKLAAASPAPTTTTTTVASATATARVSVTASSAAAPTVSGSPAPAGAQPVASGGAASLSSAASVTAPASGTPSAVTRSAAGKGWEGGWIGVVVAVALAVASL